MTFYRLLCSFDIVCIVTKVQNTKIGTRAFQTTRVTDNICKLKLIQKSCHAPKNHYVKFMPEFPCTCGKITKAQNDKYSIDTHNSR